jgi:subtilisin family serine protease
VIVAVIDTGVETAHPAVRAAILPRPFSDSWNFADDDNPAPDDDDGHGTFIAGLLVGNGQQGIHGICPGCGRCR